MASRMSHDSPPSADASPVLSPLQTGRSIGHESRSVRFQHPSSDAILAMGLSPRGHPSRDAGDLKEGAVKAMYKLSQGRHSPVHSPVRLEQRRTGVTRELLRQVHEGPISSGGDTILERMKERRGRLRKSPPSAGSPPLVKQFKPRKGSVMERLLHHSPLRSPPRQFSKSPPPPSSRQPLPTAASTNGGVSPFGVALLPRKQSSSQLIRTLTATSSGAWHIPFLRTSSGSSHSPHSLGSLSQNPAAFHGSALPTSPRSSPPKRSRRRSLSPKRHKISEKTEMVMVEVTPREAVLLQRMRERSGSPPLRVSPVPGVESRKLSPLPPLLLSTTRPGSGHLASSGSLQERNTPSPRERWSSSLWRRGGSTPPPLQESDPSSAETARSSKALLPPSDALKAALRKQVTASFSESFYAPGGPPQ